MLLSSEVMPTKSLFHNQAMLSQLADSAGLVEELSQTKTQVKVHDPVQHKQLSSPLALLPSPLQSLEGEVSRLTVALEAAHSQQRETEAMLLHTVRHDLQFEPQ